MSDDFSEYREPVGAGHNSLGELHARIEEQHRLEGEVAKLQAQLKEKQDELQNIQERVLPELMIELGVESLRTPGGLTVELAESIHASIPKSVQDQAFEWLDEHGESGMVKRTFEVKFNRDEEAWANKFQADLAKRKKPVRAEIKRKVEPPTLRAWVKNKLSEGEDIPLDLFGVFRRKVAKVSVK